jgi:DNA-binding CsgD family transcriptional regulator
MSELNSSVYVLASKGMQGPSANARWRPHYENAPSTSRLSSRESEVLHWLAHGKSGPEIAIILGISTCTVRIHIQSVKRKLDAVNIPHAVYLAVTRGILTAQPSARCR